MIYDKHLVTASVTVVDITAIITLNDGREFAEDFSATEPYGQRMDERKGTWWADGHSGYDLLWQKLNRDAGFIRLGDQYFRCTEVKEARVTAKRFRQVNVDSPYLRPEA